MRFLKITGIILLALLLLPFVAVQFFGGPIARGVVNAVNNRLQTEIQVNDYDLSLLRSFPRLSVDLTGVRVAGSDGSELLDAESLGCVLDLGSLFGKVRVSGIVVRNGSLQLYVDEDGNSNYQLLGYTSVGDQGGAAGGETAATEFAIEQARFTNVNLVFQDAQLNTDAFLLIENATFEGDFGTDRYSMATDADLHIEYIDQEGYRYVGDQAVRVEAETTIDNRVGGYAFSPLRLYAGDLGLEVTGTLTPTPDGLTTALRISSGSGNLEDVLALIPPAYAGALEELETRGSLLLSADINGAWTNDAYPRIDGKLSFTDGRLGSPRMNVGVRDLDLQASFAYLDGPRGGIQTFAIERLTGNFRNQPFDLALRIEDLDDPKVVFRADGALALNALPAFLGEGPLTDGDGFIRFNDVRIDGRYEDMLRPRRMGRVATSGQITLDDGELTLNDRQLDFPSGLLTLRDNEMELNELRLEAEGTELAFTGQATNLIPILFADSLNTQDAQLEFTATLTGERLDIDELLALAGPSEEEIEAAEASGTTDSLAKKGIERRAQITDLLNGRFEAQIQEWNYEELEGEDFRGQLLFSPGQLEVRGITDAMEGNVRLDAIAYFDASQRIDARVSALGVDAEQFFAQNNNFDQEVLTSDNLEGRMNAQLLLNLYYTGIGEIDYERLKVLAGLSIEDGELNDFGLLENFAFALKAGDLDRVRFTRLENYFEIVDQTLYIPAMFIQSSAINLTLSGSHTFNNYLDYYIKVNAGQVLANKISRHDRDLEVLPARRNGFFNLYYTVKGPLEDYVTESNKRAVKNDFTRSEYRKARVRAALEEAFAEPIRLVEPEVGEEDLTIND